MSLKIKSPTSIWQVFVLFSVLITWCGSLTTSVSGQSSGNESSRQLVIANCQIVSIKKGKILPNQMVLINDGLISETGPMQDSVFPDNWACHLLGRTSS